MVLHSHVYLESAPPLTIRWEFPSWLNDITMSSWELRVNSCWRVWPGGVCSHISRRPESDATIKWFSLNHKMSLLPAIVLAAVMPRLAMDWKSPTDSTAQMNPSHTRPVKQEDITAINPSEKYNTYIHSVDNSVNKMPCYSWKKVFWIAIVFSRQIVCITHKESTSFPKMPADT